MGIVQKQRKEIENLEAKNRMLKRMYESQRGEVVKAQVENIGLVRALKLTISKLGGTVQFTTEDLKALDGLEVVGALHSNGMMELLISGEKEAENSQE